MGSIVSPPTIEVREGTTDRLIIQLLADDVPIPLGDIDHIEIEMRDSKRNTYKYSSQDSSPKVGIVTPETLGKVYLDPPASLFKTICSPYLLYCWVVEADKTRYSVPEETEAMIQVRRNY